MNYMYILDESNPFLIHISVSSQNVFWGFCVNNQCKHKRCDTDDLWIFDYEYFDINWKRSNVLAIQVVELDLIRV